ncbi:MAG: aconitase family protein, partial [Candidatus Pacebacteria bacterium]|nr:aconitase family protein [Candidatus Paceibacterota bacterium]
MTAQTLYQKLVLHNLVKWLSKTVALLYVPRHLIHEVTSPIAFDEIEESGGKVRRPELALAVPDHNIPTEGGFETITDPYSRIQVQTLYDNAKKWGIEIYPMGHRHQGIVHIVGPEQGFTLPGTVVVCGDSHTATHGAFGALAWGIGTSEVRHVLETNTLPHTILKTRRIRVEGTLPEGTEAKDVILHIIRRLGASGGNGFAYEFAGGVIENLDGEGRATISNMSIEGGARIGLIAVDETTINWVRRTPKFLALPREMQEQAITYFRTLKSDEGAKFDDEVVIDGSEIEPMVTWGTVSDQSVPIRNGTVPLLSDFPDQKKRDSAIHALGYMGLREGMPISEIPIKRVFFGSCTNG